MVLRLIHVATFQQNHTISLCLQEEMTTTSAVSFHLLPIAESAQQIQFQYTGGGSGIPEMYQVN